MKIKSLSACLTLGAILVVNKNRDYCKKFKLLHIVYNMVQNSLEYTNVNTIKNNTMFNSLVFRASFL